MTAIQISIEDCCSGLERNWNCGRLFLWSYRRRKAWKDKEINRKGKETRKRFYKDNPYDDWTPAKLPRLKRLAINDEKNPKYKKALAFRLLDLTTIYLFIRNRKNETLLENEKDIIKNTNIDFEIYSNEKKQIMNNLIQKICI